MSLLKRIESARPGGPGENLPVPSGAGGGRDVQTDGGNGPTAAAQPRLVTQLPARESFRDVKFRIQNRVIQELDPKLDLTNQVEVRRHIE
jgi:pilus assembly protein CpaF